MPVVQSASAVEPQGVRDLHKPRTTKGLPLKLDLWAPGEPLEGPERWYPCFGYESDYFASTEGRVMRITGGPGTRPGKILKPSPNQDGYMTVRLSSGKAKTFNLHWLICRTFRGSPPRDIAGDGQVAHGPDPTLSNCRACNLNWESRFDNLMDQQQRYNKSGYWRGR